MGGRVAGGYLLQVEASLLSQNVRVQLESLESPEFYAARAAAVKTDPRVRSLSDHMLSWNYLDPESDDLSDLRPLAELLKGVRIVDPVADRRPAARCCTHVRRAARSVQDGKPFRGLAGLVDSGTKASGRGNESKSEPPPERPPKPKLDFYTILPEYETVLPEPKPAKKTARPEPAETDVRYVYVLQAASYARLEDADRLKARLTLNGFDAHIEKIAIGGKGEYFRVRLGPYESIEALDAANNKLAEHGIKAMRIKVKKTAG